MPTLPTPVPQQELSLHSVGPPAARSNPHSIKPGFFKLLTPDKSSDALSSIKVISWNIEGAKKGSPNLADFVKSSKPGMIFLSEPQIYQCDANLALSSLKPTYCHHLNSEDTFYPELALEQRHAHGGTLALWHSLLDPFITLLPTTSPAVLPLLLSIPGLKPSAHIEIYLPTSGQKEEFVIALASLSAVLESLEEDHPGTPVYVRGDANVNPSNLPRVQLLWTLQSQFSLQSLALNHPTHHHFMGEGRSDSQLDVLLYPSSPHPPEKLLQVVCGKENPLVTSHHDLIISNFSCVIVPYSTPPQATVAPKVPNTRVNVLWDKEGEEQYRSLLSSTLHLLQNSLFSPDSPSLTSVLLDCSNHALVRAAEASFRTVKLSKPPLNKQVKVAPEIREAQVSTMKAARQLKIIVNSLHTATELESAKNNLSASSSRLRAALRASNSQTAKARDELLHTVLSRDPSKLHAAVRKTKSDGTPSMHMLQVGRNVYNGDAVPDGFFEALQSLKVPEASTIDNNPDFLSVSKNYKHILEIAKCGPPLPALSTLEAEALLKRLRPDVLDLYSVSAHHYLAAGTPAIEHFASLLNLLIANTNLSSAKELNSAWAVMLHKGHGKPRSQCRSWRCISTCPLIAKALDLYVADLHQHNWKSASAPNQFMKKGSSHELAALLLTEAVCYATLTLGFTLWVLFLDKQAAFDMVLKENVITGAYAAAGHRADQSLLYMANRLSSRRTFLQFSSTLVGPINDEKGVEQGGISSGDQFQLVNGEELITTNTSGLGLDMGGISLASLGVADDVALFSPSPYGLQALLNLSQELTASKSMINVPEKTKLLAYSPKGDCSSTYWQEVAPLTMAGASLPLSTQAEHVGVLRSTGGSNLPSITSRIAGHTKSLYSVIACGMARNHRGNPAASIRVESCYSAPKLFSGLACLLLSPTEVEVLSVHRRKTLQELQRLHPKTPAPAIHFLSGSLPAPALLHIHQFTLLHMIAKLGPSNILFQHSIYILHHSIANSWFSALRTLASHYSLPDPIQTLVSPPPKNTFKSCVKSAVRSF